MTESNESTQEHILKEFLNGKSAEEICKHYDITPLKLVELFNSTKLTFPNELFDESQDQKVNLSQVQYENVQLKKEHEALARKVQDYEIEIRIHKEVLNTLLIKK